MAKKKVYTAPPEFLAALPAWRDRWIANALSTAPMTEEDRTIARQAAMDLYAAAGFPAPRVVFVPSPLVLRFAAGFAAAIWWQRQHRDSPLSVAQATDQATYQATTQTTRQATYQATYQATALATRQATHQVTRQATRQATHQVTRQATAQATYQATDQATDRATTQATYQATVLATRQATDLATHQVTRQATDLATRQATAQATYQATDQATALATAQATDLATAQATYLATTQATDLATDQATDQATAQAGERWYTGAPSRELVQLGRKLTGSDFGLRCVQATYNLWQGGNQWSAWDSYITAFRYLAKLPLDYTKWDAWERLSLHSGPRCIHPEFCMISDRPRALTQDAESRPHNATGPFCQWSDGFSLYAWHGTFVPAWVIEAPERLTPETITAEPNQEIRRAMIERIGWDHYLTMAQAVTLQADDFGTLLELPPLDESAPTRLVRVTNSTPEPDGTWKDYVLRVPPTVTSAHEAVAWTNWRELANYHPMVQT